MAIVGLRHIGLKVMSIALAALLWLVVAGEQTVERALRIPLEFTNMPAQLEPVGEPPTVVDVRVRGSSGRLSRIAAGELVAVVDLQGARPGQRLFHVSGSDVRAPFGVEVLQVAPSSLYMTFEPSATKVVPVLPEVEGDPAPGYRDWRTERRSRRRLKSLDPRPRWQRMKTAITEPVSVAGAIGDDCGDGQCRRVRSQRSSQERRPRARHRDHQAGAASGPIGEPWVGCSEQTEYAGRPVSIRSTSRRCGGSAPRSLGRCGTATSPCGSSPAATRANPAAGSSASSPSASALRVAS